MGDYGDSVIPVNDLLSQERCSSYAGGLPQYAEALRVNLGVGPGLQRIPESRLRRLTASGLSTMNIRMHDHQVAIMGAVRSILEGIDAKRAAEAEAQQAQQAAQAASEALKEEHERLEAEAHASRMRRLPFVKTGPSSPSCVQPDMSDKQKKREIATTTNRALGRVLAKPRSLEAQGGQTMEMRGRPTAHAFEANQKADQKSGGGKEPSAISHAIAGPRFAAQMSAFRTAVREHVSAVTKATNCAGGFVVFADTRNMRFYHFNEPASQEQQLKAKSGSFGKDGPANCIIWSCKPPTQSGQLQLGVEGLLSGAMTSQGVCLQALHASTSVNLDEPANDPRFSMVHEPYLSSKLRHAPKNLLAVPVFADFGPHSGTGAAAGTHGGPHSGTGAAGNNSGTGLSFGNTFGTTGASSTGRSTGVDGFDPSKTAGSLATTSSHGPGIPGASLQAGSKAAGGSGAAWKGMGPELPGLYDTVGVLVLLNRKGPRFTPKDEAAAAAAAHRMSAKLEDGFHEILENSTFKEWLALQKKLP